MDLPTLTKLVRTTPILNEAERTWWLTYLPTMKPEQCERLEQILTQPINLPFGAIITNFFRGLTQSRV